LKSATAGRVRRKLALNGAKALSDVVFLRTEVNKPVLLLAKNKLAEPEAASLFLAA
jgi:hypothetical protein